MPNALQVLHRAIESGTTANEDCRWEDLHAAMRVVISAPLSSEAEHLLLSILRFDGQIQFDPSSEFPHSMPPKDMLKSLAAQALEKRRGATYLLEMWKLQAKAMSPALASVIRAVIKQMGQSRKQRMVLEGVGESSPEAPSTIRIRLVKTEGDQTSYADQPIQRREEDWKEREKVSRKKAA